MSSPDLGPDTSLSALVATLVPTFIVAAVYVCIFLILRKSHRRFYAPRTYLGSLREQYVSSSSLIPRVMHIPI